MRLETDGTGAGFFFFVEKLSEDAPPAAMELERLDVPAGVSCLRDLRDLEDGLVPGGTDEHLCFEPVSWDRKPAVVMSAPPGRVRLNGHRAPRLSVLDVGDQVSQDETVLHLSRIRRPHVGTAPKDLVGRNCPVCMVPFAEASNVVVCECGAGLHLDPESVPESERLDCALLGSCPTCDQPVSLEAGVVFLPELL